MLSLLPRSFPLKDISGFTGCFFSLLFAGGPSCRGSAWDPSTFWDRLFLTVSWDLHPSDTEIFLMEEICLLADARFSCIPRADDSAVLHFPFCAKLLGKSLPCSQHAQLELFFLKNFFFSLS